MTYSLNTTLINPSSNSAPKNIVILCHGYGGDGKDISVLAGYWKNFLPDTLFVCPNAPEVCKVNSEGFQWFDLMDQTDDEILTGHLTCTECDEFYPIDNSLPNFLPKKIMDAVEDQ